MKIIFTLFLAALSYTVSAQNVNIPDPVFKFLLVNNSAINTNGDSEIQVTEAAAATVLTVRDTNVTNLTGLSAFTGLITLAVINIPATSINLSANTNLDELALIDVPITSLDISMLTVMRDFAVIRTPITTINLPNSTAPFYTIQLNEINTLTALNLGSPTSLVSLNLDQVSLPASSINFGTTTTTVRNITIVENPATNFYLSTFSQLQSFDASSSKLKVIDASQNALLTRINVSSNDSLTTLNIANGNNANMTTMNATLCPNLTCIYVDSAIVGTTPAGWQKDTTATYCYDTTTVVGVSREFSSANEVRFYPNPAANYLSIENAQIGSTLWISDALGRVVLRQELNSENSEIATSQLQNGIYFIQFELNGLRTRAEKILISK